LDYERGVKVTIVAILQARMTSERLPGKVLLEVSGKPVLWHVVARLRGSKLIEKFVVATTTNVEDVPIIKLCNEMGIGAYAGSEEDVLDRYYKAAKQYGAKVIVRVTADCPLIDPKIVDRVIQYYLENKDKFDYVSTNHPTTFPDGMDTEVFSFEALEKAWKEAKKQYQREHVTPYIWDQPEKFKIGNVENDEDLSTTERWTLDYKEDFEFISAVYANLYKEGEIFSMQDVLNLLKKKPELRDINKKYLGFNWYALQNHLDELRTVDKSKYKLDKSKKASNKP
jgi:spore coat polysaccharide biosynthesis protein SpsF